MATEYSLFCRETKTYINLGKRLLAESQFQMDASRVARFMVSCIESGKATFELHHDGGTDPKDRDDTWQLVDGWGCSCKTYPGVDEPSKHEPTCQHYDPPYDTGGHRVQPHYGLLAHFAGAEEWYVGPVHTIGLDAEAPSPAPCSERFVWTFTDLPEGRSGTVSLKLYSKLVEALTDAVDSIERIENLPESRPGDSS